MTTEWFSNGSNYQWQHVLDGLRIPSMAGRFLAIRVLLALQGAFSSIFFTSMLLYAQNTPWRSFMTMRFISDMADDYWVGEQVDWKNYKVYEGEGCLARLLGT
ncbi:hypothetical protein R6Q57_022897 [Mikania cordata]